MTNDRRSDALDELSAPLGALVHSVNNALAVIATTTYALQIEQRLTAEDADAILGGIEAARRAFANYEPIVRSRRTPEVPVAGVPYIDVASTIGALTGRRITLRWHSLPPQVTDLTRVTRRLIGSLWAATDDLGADDLLVKPAIVDGRLMLSVEAPDGRVWGPTEVGTPV